MPITVSGTEITFNDATTQSTAAAASSFIGNQGQVFTSNGTFTIPTGITALKVTVVGGGGGGSGGRFVCCQNAQGGGGGGGGTAISYLTSLTPGNTISVTIGAGGSAGGNNTNGGAGGNSSIASGTQSITTVTGNGGGAGTTTPANGAGGSASNGTLNLPGSRASSTPIAGGDSFFGFRGMKATNTPGVGEAGSGRGGGGSTGVGPNGGGAGTAGVVIFEF